MEWMYEQTDGRTDTYSSCLVVSWRHAFVPSTEPDAADASEMHTVGLHAMACNVQVLLEKVLMQPTGRPELEV